MRLNKLFSHRVLSLIISILMFASFAVGDVDNSFVPNLKKNLPADSTTGFTIQPDGKFLVYKIYQENNVYRTILYRLNSDGTPDPSFTTYYIPNNSLDGIIGILVGIDGKIYISGGVSGSVRMVKLNSNGSLDTSFNNTPVQCGGSCNLYIVKIQFDGKIYAMRSFTATRLYVVTLYRYNVDGSQDTTFTPLIYDYRNGQRLTKLVVLPNGKILISGVHQNGFLFRLNSDGTKDITFESPVVADSTCGTSCTPYISSFILKDNGKVVVTGYFDSINGVTSYRAISRLNSDGSVDMSYSGQTPQSTVGVPFAEKLSDGKYIVWYYSNIFGYSYYTRYNSDDSVDSTFNTSPNITPTYFLLDNLDRITTLAFRLNYDGSLDNSYNLSTPQIDGKVSTLARQPDGKLIAAGDFIKSNSTTRTRLVRLNTDGTTDNSFNAGSGFDIDPTTITVQSNGKILAAGYFSTFNGVAKNNLVRLNSDGSLDSTFIGTVDNVVSDVLPLSNGKIMIGGSFAAFNGTARPNLARLNADGTLDSSFNASVNGSVLSIFLQSDGKFMVYGNFSGIGGFARSRVARLNSDGTVDSTFNSGSAISSIVNTAQNIIQQSDGKYLIKTYPENSNNFKSLIRFNSDGSIDSSFNPTSSALLNRIYLQPDGLIVIGGVFTSVNGTPRKNIARLKTDGTLDAAYVTEGADDQINAMVAQPDGKLFVGGNFSNIGGVARTGLARINNIALIGARPLFDFDGDGKADVSVYRASTNTWYRLLSGNSTVLQSNFGIADDIPTSADYDGDGKTDLAIFRPATGTFWYQSSINNAQIATQWGQPGDIPRPSDFDGDGKADFVLYRPNELNWYRLGSTGQVSIKAFGAIGDKPVSGDFDGDGKSDVAIYRPSSGDWWYQSSINNAQLVTHFGASTDTPSAADFDGDGKTDFAVYRSNTGVWYVLNSSTGLATIVQFGIAEDKPVPADYDGDGKADIAVFRPSSGIWYELRSTSGFTALQFGISSDVPVPNSFIQ
jgi:uncharacterized delta-60 repeat protein